MISLDKLHLNIRYSLQAIICYYSLYKPHNDQLRPKGYEKSCITFSNTTHKPLRACYLQIKYIRLAIGL